MKVKIKVTYNLKDTDDRERLEKFINKKMELLGAKFYAQGTDLVSQERDMCYDLTIPYIKPKRVIQVL